MKLSPHALSLRQLQYVVAVDEMRNFRRAAELCHVSQPSLSAQLAQLEEALGVKVFERSRRQVLPTTAGEELIRRARRVLLEADDLLEAAQRLGDPLAGTLRIGVIPTVSPYMLPDTAPRITHAHPQLTIRWIEDKTPTLVERLARGELDAALLALEADIGVLEHAEVARDHFYVAAPEDHTIAESQAPVTLDALDEEQVLLLDDGHCLRYQTLQLCQHAGVEELGFRATSLSTLVQMVASGAGITLLPALAIPTEVARGRLTIRPIASPPPYRTLALVWRPASPMTEALKELAQTMCAAHEDAVERNREQLQSLGVSL
ncbi:MAG: LysR substrate-binding domain-containing protein [Pseudomonadota bacterium]